MQQVRGLLTDWTFDLCAEADEVQSEPVCSEQKRQGLEQFNWFNWFNWFNSFVHNH